MAAYHVRGLSFQTTYEELKPRSDRMELYGRYWRFQTTYEELKRNFRTYSGMSCTVFRLPMRNWNKEEADRVGITLSFQTTYEELKRTQSQQSQCGWLSFSDYLWGIETGMYLWQIPRIHCFQTTYEELKLESEKCIPPGYLVFRLPMRNWNKLFKSFIEDITLFSDYLWGIETEIPAKEIRTAIRFSDYLWGIETGA